MKDHPDADIKVGSQQGIRQAAGRTWVYFKNQFNSGWKSGVHGTFLCDTDPASKFAYRERGYGIGTEGNVSFEKAAAKALVQGGAAYAAAKKLVEEYEAEK